MGQTANQIAGSVVAVLGHLTWPILILILLLIFQRDTRRLLRIFADRLRSGAALKMGKFEVGAVDVRHVNLGHPTGEGRTDDGTRTKERDAYYQACRSVLLVHRLARSRLDRQEFDILVYLVPHEDKGTLQSVQKVEYFLGKFWQSVIFTSTNRFAGFPFRLSAYGPTLCSAKLHFTDGASTTLYRYLDFEMGDTAPLLQDKRDKP